MKPFALLLLLITAAVFTGCESDMPPEPNRVNPVQRGLRGEGKIAPLDYSDDPYVRSGSSN